MTLQQILMLWLLGAFYAAYVTKMLLLKRQGIRGDILGKGEKPGGKIVLERLIKAATYCGVAVQLMSVLFPALIWSFPAFPTMVEDGLILSAAGVTFFIAAVVTMKSNWRAGFSDDQKTSLVTGGIYKISRNPAFVGFDLLYIGCALCFPNVVNIAATLLVIVLFHLQILGEEKFLAAAFGAEYMVYRKKVFRYFGRR